MENEIQARYLFLITAFAAAACDNEMAGSGNDSVQTDGEAADADASYHRPVFSPDGSHIVYMKQDASTDGDWELFLTDADGGNEKRLTVNQGWDGYASFSPDGNRIAFARNDGEDPKYVVIMNIETGETSQFAGEEGWLSISGWADDGERLFGFYETDGQRDIVFTSVSGEILENVTQTSDQSESDPFLYSDHRTLYFSSSSEAGGAALERIDLETRTREVLVRSDGGRIYGGALSPDGVTVSYNDDAPGGDDSDAEIYFLNLETGGIRQMTDNTDWDHLAVWDPVNANVLFNSYRSGKERIYRMDPKTGDVTSF